MTKSPGMYALTAAVWIITAIGSLHVGLMAMGYNMLHMQFLAGLARPIEYIFGIAGVLSLILFVVHGSCCHCDKHH